MASTIALQQAPNTVVMVRPHHFKSNPQTMADNKFQTLANNDNAKYNAYNEVTAAVNTLRSHGVCVQLFEDLLGNTPDSVFPNNWFTTHHNGMLIKYPMLAENRRLEYRQDIIDAISDRYSVTEHVDLRHYAEQELFLEGTGSIVFDHPNRLAYACQSRRTDTRLLQRVCQYLHYQPVVFDAFDNAGVPVYHTNVLMCVGTRFVMISMDMVAEADRDRLLQYFNLNRQQLIWLTEKQIQRFCGNAIELQGTEGALLALSQTAYNALTQQQKLKLEKFVKLVPLSIPTIESAGGSVRCMIAGVHYPE
ncbi:amidinotransferase [Marinomonas sp. M1K-6]|uniref:Amidinotransferase n=1 Tax=Marinomonas profundi TaxID=2726122 RepID=A0A847R2U0_9GAMM|nr:arginine deiminase-related protein [Marinomonas profundi]NLQ16206.1 amidinotransferase [Marinomonas profundi]UDV03213.1 amidinotransferase [Marinomonas profundi]